MGSSLGEKKGGKEGGEGRRKETYQQYPDSKGATLEGNCLINSPNFVCVSRCEKQLVH